MLFLRSFLLNAKRKTVRKFPTTIKTASNARALHSAIPSDLEGKRKPSVANEDVFRKSMVADIFFISWLIKPRMYIKFSILFQTTGQ